LPAFWATFAAAFFLGCIFLIKRIY
jgi:hypothetical protein